MTKLLFSALAVVLLCACSPEKHFRDVSAPAQKKAAAGFTDTLPVMVTTTDIPEHPLVLSSANAKEKIDQAMNNVMLRLKGSLVHQPQVPAGDAALNTGGPFQIDAQVRKMTYVTGITETGTFFSDDMSVGIEIVSIDFVASDTTSEKEGRLVSVRFPDGKRKLKLEGVAAVFNAKPSFAYECNVGVKVFGQLEDGTYAAERTTVKAKVVIANDFEMELKLN
jgi:hypothetical protein